MYLFNIDVYSKYSYFGATLKLAANLIDFLPAFSSSNPAYLWG